jgi:hypothetical protein
VDFFIYNYDFLFVEKNKVLEKPIYLIFSLKNKALTSGSYNGLLTLRNLQNNKSCNQEIPSP